MKKALFSGAVVCACVLGLWARSESAGTIDITSGASVKVTGGTITDTSAIIKWSEPETNGTFRIYWDTVNVARGKQHDSLTVPNTSSSRGTAASYMISKKLKPSHKYYFILYAYDPSHGTYTTNSTFTTGSATTGLSPRSPSLSPELHKNAVDLLGRKAGTGFGVLITNQGQQLGTGTTSRSATTQP